MHMHVQLIMTCTHVLGAVSPVGAACAMLFFLLHVLCSCDVFRFFLSGVLLAIIVMRMETVSQHT